MEELHFMDTVEVRYGDIKQKTTKGFLVNFIQQKNGELYNSVVIVFKEIESGNHYRSSFLGHEIKIMICRMVLIEKNNLKVCRIINNIITWK
jgi:hypothetical protein